MCLTKLIKAQVPAGECANKAPGLNKIYLAEAAWLSTNPARDDYFNGSGEPISVTSDITFDTGTYSAAGWYEWDFQPRTLDLNQELQGEVGAQYYTSNLSGKIAGHHKNVDQAVDWLPGLELIALVQDKDGNWIRVGSASNPLIASEIVSKYGTRAGEEIGFDITLNVDAHNRLWPYYTGAISPIK